MIGVPTSATRHRRTSSWQAKYSENRTQKFEPTHLDQAFNKENHLFFQVNSNARYRLGLLINKVEFGVDIHIKLQV